MRNKHLAKLPVIGREFILFVVANFMLFGNCLGVLDSCAGMDFVEQDYQTRQINLPEVYAESEVKPSALATSDQHVPSPDAKSVFDNYENISLLKKKIKYQVFNSQAHYGE